MKKHLRSFKEFLSEAKDPTYYQETFYFTILISMSKEMGGSRDETKNDIRAVPEVLTVTLIEPEKGGVQRDLGTKYLSSLKLHVRKPKEVNKVDLMRRLVLHISNLRGVSVLRYKEHKPKPRRKAFRGTYKITELDYQKVRRQKAAEYQKDKAQYISTGPQKTGGTPFTKKASTKRGKSAPAGFGGLEEETLDEDILITIEKEKDNLMAFDTNRELNQKIWNDEKEIRRGVKGAMMDILDEFLEGLEMDLDIKDIVLTGSMANYNWSKFSDLDLHILVDFAEVNENEAMVKKFFDAVRSRWNKLHYITIKGHEVEIYVQDEHEPHTSTGVYSLMKDEWLIKPQKIKPEIDEATTQKKVEAVVKELDKLRSLYDNKLYEQSLEAAQRVKDKIGRMRKGGLERAGIYSPENLAFKMLRRSGDIEKLFDIYTKSYDKVFSLDQ